MQKVVAFDLDGTLVDSKHHLLPAYRESLARMGRAQLPDEVLLQCIGGTKEDNHALVMPECDWETYLRYELLVAEYAARFAKTKGRPYPHIREALDELRGRGYRTVLCSNGTPEYVYPLLEAVGLAGHLDAVQKLRTERNKTELLAALIRDFDCMGNVVMAGDRHFDAEAARNNGTPFIGCRYGLFPGEIGEARPEMTVDDPAALPDAVTHLLGPSGTPK